jgi:biotin transport system substrate-specific component
MTIADIARPANRRSARYYDLSLILAFSFFIALLAQAAIPLPFSPVPITGQTLGVLLAGLLLGSRRGAACLLVYLAEGALGLPVFAGGTAGPAVLVGPTAGYLAGFVLAAYLVGRMAERGWDRSYGGTFLAMLLGNLAIYACGVTWLALYLGDFGRALVGGLLPFIPGDLLKILLAVALLPTGWRLLGRGGPGE